MKSLTLLSTFALSCSLAFQAQALSPNVDLRDLVKYGSTRDQQDAQALIGQINQSPAKFGIPSGLTYASHAQTAVGQAAISTIEIQNQTATGFDLYLIYAGDERVWLKKMHVDERGQVSGISATDLARNPVSVQVDILNRQAMITESRSGFLKFAPVSLGSLIHQRLGDSTSGYKSLSRIFEHAILSRSKSELSRTDPDYYAGRPFLRIVDFDQDAFGGFTPLGVHYQLSAVLQRGFISNGCFRLRDVDLYELATIVFLSHKSGVPFAVVESTTNGNRHPYPLINSWFNSPQVTVDDDGKTVLLTGEHGLYFFNKIEGQPQELLTSATR